MVCCPFFLQDKFRFVKALMSHVVMFDVPGLFRCLLGGARVDFFGGMRPLKMTVVTVNLKCTAKSFDVPCGNATGIQIQYMFHC